MGQYIKNLFENNILVALSTIWGVIAAFLFPESAILTAAGAVLGIMLLDLLTKLFALSKQAGGLRKAIQGHRITSAKFARGTMDKLIVFGIMLIVGGCAYRISPFAAVATGFMQIVFSLMFLRDVLSIIENLTDAGVSGLGLFKKVFQKKLEDYTGEEPESSDSTDNTGGGPI